MLLQMASFHSFYGWVIVHHIYVYIYISHLLYLFVDGHIDCFHVLAIVNSAAMNIMVNASVWIRVLGEFHSWCHSWCLVLQAERWAGKGPEAGSDTPTWIPSDHKCGLRPPTLVVRKVEKHDLDMWKSSPSVEWLWSKKGDGGPTLQAE